MEDLGSGCLVDLTRYGFPHEPTVPEVIASGVDLVSFSGDKLLGGPQAGILVGREDLVARLAKNPLNRALRIDKLTVAALEATLYAYEAGTALTTIPTLAMLTEPLDAIRQRARRLLRRLPEATARALGATIVESRSQVGGGALPTVELPTAALALGTAARPAQGARRRAAGADIRRSSRASPTTDCSSTAARSRTPKCPRSPARSPRCDRTLGTTASAMHVVVGTAGHIDHGKTSLVKALTGTDTDRLPEEKARGITIDLGFAFLQEADGLTVEIVDVPGHERFVKNMLAGVGGIDLALMVIAADEGVMPQTREHLAICSLLHIKAGLVALTKTDLAEPDWLELVTEDVRTLLEGTFLAGCPIVPVSVKTGAGLAELRVAIAELARAVPQRSTDQTPRLPIDRVFTIRGFGTVVTGTLAAGRFAVEDRVEVYPRGVASRLRGLQVHGHGVESAAAGQRTALNLQGVERAAIERGDVVAPPARSCRRSWPTPRSSCSRTRRARSRRATACAFMSGRRR